MQWFNRNLGLQKQKQPRKSLRLSFDGRSCSAGKKRPDLVHFFFFFFTIDTFFVLLVAFFVGGALGRRCLLGNIQQYFSDPGRGVCSSQSLDYSAKK